VHGGGGKDVMEGGDAVHTIAAVHAKHGTTSMLATTMTAPPEDIDLALRGIGVAAAARQRRSARARRTPGRPVHQLRQAGRAAAFARSAKLADVEKLEALAPLRVITVAPEIAGHLELVKELSDAGMRVQIGHTLGTYEDGVAALEQRRSQLHPPVQRHARPASPRTGHGRRRAGACQICRADSRSAARASGCHPHRCAASPTCTASPIQLPPPACRTANICWAATKS
jgi:hypothetical protein